MADHRKVDTFVSTGTWACPAGVTSAVVECWGAGGGGTDSVGGGGGGAYSLTTVTVSEGNYDITVGTSAGDTDGGDSSFDDASEVLAKGGLSGTNGGTGGASASGIGDTKYSGGDGELGAAVENGGGAAGDSASGSNENGGASNGPGQLTGGQPGRFWGVGGGGSTGGDRAGTAGQVRVTYDFSTAAEYAVVETRSWGRDTSATTSHSITMPAGIQAGDLLIIVWSGSGDDDGAGDHEISSGGWTRLGVDSNSTTITSAIFYKIAAGIDTATVTTTDSVIGTHIVFRILNDGGLPTATSADGSSTNVNPPSHDAGSSQKHLWIATGSLHANSGNQNISAQPSGYSGFITETPDIGSAGTVTIVSDKHDESQVEDPGVWTSTSEQWVAWTISVPFSSLSVETKTFTADAFLEVTNTKTFTADAFLQATLTKIFTVDAFLQATETKTFTADAFLEATFTKTFTADAILKATQTNTFTADAFLLDAFTKTFTADALLQATFTKTFTADSFILGPPLIVSPDGGANVTSPRYLVFTTASISSGVKRHFLLEVDDTSDVFGSLELDLNSKNSQTNWEFWDGDSWEALPANGLDPAYYGNDVRYQATLADGDKWWRVAEQLRRDS